MLGFVGVFGGLVADVPGVHEDPTANGILTFFSRFMKTILYVIGHYPDGVILFLVVLSLLVWFLDEVPLQKRKLEFEEKRNRLARQKRTKIRKRGKS